MGLVALILFSSVLSAVANPKSGRGLWWRIPALVALFALFGPFLHLLVHGY
jgi:hypothetical protein